MPQVVWTDHRRRLVVVTDAVPPASPYRLEVKEGDPDAMGKAHWRPTELTWELFQAILDGVLNWKPVQLNPEDLQ